MKKTFKELNKFSSTIRGLITKNKTLIDTKFGYAIKRFEEINLETPYKDYNSVLMEIRIDNALTDKVTGALLKDPNPKSERTFLYDKAGLKALILAEQAIEKEWNKKEFEIEPYICKPENVLTTLTEEEREVFSGLIIE